MNETIHMPVVSVIIPTHNAATTIERCIESVENQTYSNIEIICCDDCSTDNTYHKLEELAKKYSNIIVLKNESNHGAAYTRNRCIEKCTGKYVAQIDDDDYMVLNRIKTQVDILEKNAEYDFLGTGIYYFDENGVWGSSSDKECRCPEKKDFLWSSVFANPTMMYRITALQAVGGYRVAKETRRGQDYDMHMRMYAQGLKGYLIPDKLTYYYRGKKSYPKCKYKYRIAEAIIRYKNYKKLGLMPLGMIYVIKPLIVGLVPIKVLEKMKKKKALDYTE